MIAALAGAVAVAAIGVTTATAAAASTQVLVRGGPGCSAAVAATITRLGGRVVRPLGILDGATAQLSTSNLAALRAAPCVAAVTADGAVSLDSFGGYDPTAGVGSVYNTTQEIGAQSYWRAGFTGKGVGVALIDSGVSPVPGLGGAGKLVAGPDISFDSQSPSLQTLDGFGHGTHMAGIIAGNDGTLSAKAYAGNTSQFVGVAPDAQVVNVKVADAHGAVDVSQVIAGIDWTVQHAQDNGLNIRVLNLSFGTDSTQTYLLDPLAYAAEQAYLHGIVVVVAAGNGGPGTAGLADPAMDPFVIAVGAADTNGTTSTSDDTVATFSSRGSATRPPDLVAPGVHIEGLRDPGSYIDTQFGSTATVAQRFFLGSGTSQATAVVSGAAALILQQHPTWSPDQVRFALDVSARSLNQDVSLQGAGEVNLTPILRAGSWLSSVAVPGSSSSATMTASSSEGTSSVSASASVSLSLAVSGSAASKWRPAAATGTGSLDAARGSIHLVNNGVTLSGEQDIFGNAWSSSSMATAEANAAAWNGGTFNGSGWAGSGWAGSGWANATWTNNAWSGSGWAGSGWAGNTWAGSGWAGSGWAGSGWAGSGWADALWN